MAHLLVTNETVIDQDSENRSSIGKHKRGGKGLTCQEGAAWSDTGNTTKRQALATITNQPHHLLPNPSKPFSYASSQKKHVPLPTSSPNGSGSFFYCDEPEIKPIGSEMNCSANDSKMSLSIPLSASYRSMESISFESPMLVSSPDVFASKFRSDDFVDIDNLEDATAGEYAGEIFGYFREAEVRFHPNPHYMKKQPDITEGMRSILIDWLVEVAEEFKLDQHTLYMSISIVDRFLSNMSVLRSKLQLVGATAMYIASKFEEIQPPEIADFTYITDDTYTKAQIVRMERLILKTLDFNLSAPTSHVFLLRYLKASEVDLSSTLPGSGISQTITYLSMYLCELALQDADPYLKHYPSVIAASAVCLARHSTGQVAWPRILEHYSGYRVSDISNCVQDLHRTLGLAPQHSQQAIRNKYSSEAYHMISAIKAPETLPC